MDHLSPRHHHGGEQWKRRPAATAALLSMRPKVGEGHAGDCEGSAADARRSRRGRAPQIANAAVPALSDDGEHGPAWPRAEGRRRANYPTGRTLAAGTEGAAVAGTLCAVHGHRKERG